MKKRYNIILTFAVSLFLLSSCYDLDRTSSNEVSESKFWKNQDQVKQGIMGIYAQMRQEQAFGMKFNNDGMGDTQAGNDGGGYRPIITGVATDRTAQVENKWKHLIEGVHRANLAIRKITQMGDLMSQEKKDLYIAESRFMRAIYYFEMHTFYGEIPLYDETFDVGKDYMNAKNPRSSVADVVKFIVADLDAAIQYLPVKWAPTEYGRATKGAAYALRGKIQLFQKEYAKAILDFEEIILDKTNQGYGYALYASYPNLFTPEGDQSSEMIFAIQNQGGVGMAYGMPMTFYMGSRASFGSDWNNVVPSVSLVDMYENVDGKPFNWNDLVPRYNEDDAVKEKTFLSVLDKGKVTVYTPSKALLLDMYTKRDPRMNQTILLPYTEYNGWLSNAPKKFEFVMSSTTDPQEANGYVRIQGAGKTYLFRKFVAEGNMDGQITAREHTPINFPLIRLADVYLMYAECKNELNDQATAVEYINKVRQRPSTNMPALNSGPAWLVATTKQQVFTRIMHERAVELVAEGHRYNDLRRWGVAKAMLDDKKEKEITGKVIYTHVFKDKQMLWPVPGLEVERNPAILPNNPDW